MEVESSSISAADPEREQTQDVEVAVENSVDNLMETLENNSGFTGASNVRVDIGAMEIPETGVSSSTETTAEAIADTETAVPVAEVQVTGTGIEKVDKIIEESVGNLPQEDAGSLIESKLEDSAIERVENQEDSENVGDQERSVEVSVADDETTTTSLSIKTNILALEEAGSGDVEIVDVPKSITEENQPASTAADEEVPVSVERLLVETIDDEGDESAPWNRNSCIVCNVRMDSIEPADPNQVEGNKKLKKFFLEYLGVSETMDLTASDSSFPFCASCADDLDKLMALACKIEFMDLQFEKLRDTLARKTVKTYLCRTRPDILGDDAEQIIDVQDEPLDMNAPRQLIKPGDVLFNQWKRQYDLIIPGRYKKFPTLMKTVDPKQRVSYYRIDPSGKHHFIATINPEPGPETTLSVSPAGRGVKRRVAAAVLKVNGDTLGIKRMKSLSDEKTDDSEDEGDRAVELDSTEEERQYKCSLCPKAFNSRSILNYHSRIHSGERPFKCNICEKTFAQRGGLATHSLVHSGEKPYHCDDCGKSFRQKYHLTQHQLIHSGLKPFSCEICHKSFNVKMNLREHMRRHTGERPYRCMYCTCQGFFRKKMLRDHIVKSHPERPLPAELQNLGPTPKFPKGRILSVPQLMKVEQEDDEEQDSMMGMQGSATSSTLISVNSGAVPQLDNILADDSQPNTDDVEATSAQSLDLIDKKLLPQEPPLQAHFATNDGIIEGRESPLKAPGEPQQVLVGGGGTTESLGTA